MKILRFCFLFLASTSNLYIFSQEINIYNTIPSTINLKITAPRQPVEQVDWSKVGRDMSTSLNQIASEREAQKQALYEITQLAKRKVQEQKLMSYSITFMNLISELQSDIIEQIDLDYSMLTSGRRDPYSYSATIIDRVNMYFTFLGQIEKTNQKLNNTIYELAQSNQNYLLSDLAKLLDDKNSNFVLFMTSNYRSISKRYSSEPYNIRIAMVKKDTKQEMSISIYQQLIEVLCNEVIQVSKTVNNGINSQIVLDEKLLTPIDFNFCKISLPLTFNVVKRNYFDGTTIEFYIFESTRKNFSQKIENQIEMTTFLTQLKNSANPNSAYFGLSVDTNCVVVKVNKNTTAESLKMLVGDKILTVNGVKYSNSDQLNSSNFKIGQKITISVQRGKEVKILTSLMKSNPDAIESFDIIIAEKPGIMYCFKKDVEDYGELKSEILAFVAFPSSKDPLDLTMLYYIIKPSSELQKSGSKEILKLFKPLIKSMNESLIFN
jgi:hypothetical protein